MLVSVLANSVSASKSLTAKGWCTVHFKCTPNPSGKEPFFTSFQELFILTGTTVASGQNLNNIFNPLGENFLGMPVLLLVPSGKITADLLV